MNTKLIIRNIILAFLLFLTYKVTSVEYLLMLKEMEQFVAGSIVGSVFGALTLVLKFHFENKT
ncbi:hypothetical protein TPMD03_51 [Thiohalocapsa phage LS06-2018-MD03]|nr:hypothetical protein TPMD03_51 [Thiohalocapsa phage LS06-2018-MD03]